jgi:hypothetical protein
VKDRPRLRQLLALLLATVVPRAIWLFRVPAFVISIDLNAWGVVVQELKQGHNPYVVTKFLSWPPLWMVLLRFFGFLTDHLGGSVELWIRVFLILLDALSVLLVYEFIRKYLPKANAFRLALLGLALNPISILLTCQHGNFDVLMMLWVLAALHALARFGSRGEEQDWLFGCLFVGLGVLTKTVPFVLAPLLFAGTARLPRRTKVLGAALAAGPAALGTATILALASDEVIHKVLLYRSGAVGFWGITGILQASGLESWSESYPHVYTLAQLLVLGAVSWKLRKRDMLSPHDLATTAALLFLGGVTFGPAIGTQYAAWMIPLLVISFAGGTVFWHRTLRALYAVAALSYVAAYAIFAHLGSWLRATTFLDHSWAPTLLTYGKLGEDPGTMRHFFFPLFVSCMLTFAIGLGDLLAPRSAVSRVQADTP